MSFLLHLMVGCVYLGGFSIYIPLLVIAGFAIGFAMTDKNLHRPHPDQREKVMYFHDDREKIQLATSRHRVCFKNRRDGDMNVFFMQITH